MSYAIFVLAALIAATPAVSFSQEPDNTKVNSRDRKTSANTADQQKENANDRQTSANIRKALMDSKDLSTYAHNVKIITKNGMVTLKGPVRSEEEKKTIESKAEEVAGAGKVKSMLTVKPKKS